MDHTEEAYHQAVEVLRLCATKHGFYASHPGYDAVWARDSMITSIGASLVDDAKLKNAFKQSLLLLAKHQSPAGEIPNAVDIFSRRKPHVDFSSIDSSLWYIIGHFIYQQRYGDSSLIKAEANSIERALNWLRCQETGKNHMLGQLPTTDWQDAFPHRYGHTINSMALYYKVLNLVQQRKSAGILQQSSNHDPDARLWNASYYLAWRWKNHGSYKERGDWFDSLGNILAVLFGLAAEPMAKRILRHIRQQRISKPYPIKSIYPPIRRGTKDWQDYFDDCDAGTPYHYLNAGIWTYIGGLYVTALVKMNQMNEARKQLASLAEANTISNFSEWLDGNTGKPSRGRNQAWNAGMYILAYHSVKAGRSLI
ncbi:MAG TPA: glycoside hydrolase 100 family protein [Candidatus Nanoarchaeia archaeon]|nr:glycoside hydrolase 100 family protein [Candidatus Nanoarchaeia archaeon]